MSLDDTSRAFLDGGASTDRQYQMMGQHPWAVISAVAAVSIAGQIFLIALLVAIAFSNTPRTQNPILLIFIIAAVLYSNSPLMLFYAGHIIDIHPPEGLCLAQAAIKHATDSMFAIAPFCLVLDLFWKTQNDLSGVQMPTRLRHTLIIAPYVFGLIWAICTAALGIRNPDLVQHETEDIFCVVNIFWFGRGWEFYALIFDLSAIILEVWALVRVRRAWPTIRTRKMTKTEVSLILRLGLFAVFQMFYLIACTFAFVPGYGAEWNNLLYPALVPTAILLIFGIGKNYWNVYKCFPRIRGKGTST